HGTVANFGLVAGALHGVQVVYGFPASADAGNIINYGRIIGTTGAGVLLGNPAVTLANSGTITGSAAAGVQFGDGAATVVNSGTIAGLSGTAVMFGRGAGLLVVEPGAVFNGVLAGFQSLNTIDLAHTTATGAIYSNGTLTV